MRAIWISGVCLAAFVTSPAPAQAQRWSDPNFVAAANVTVHRNTELVGNVRRHPGDGNRHARATRSGRGYAVWPVSLRNSSRRVVRAIMPFPPTRE